MCDFSKSLKEELMYLADKAREHSYAPYSNFRVSCLVKTRAGNIYKGVNIENAAYSPTLCAERSAMSAAISNGQRDFDIIVINGDSKDTYPCGVCRQFIREFADDNTKIVIANDVDDYKIYSIDDLLPHSFSSKDLDKI